MKRIEAIVCVAMLASIAGCASTKGGPSVSTSALPGVDSTAIVPEGSVRFLVMGDIGSGDDNARAVASAAATVCRRDGCLFSIVAGDNIYPAGVRNEFDPQFVFKFEQIYKQLDFPFYLVLGNHDNGGGDGGNPIAGDHEVAYGSREDRMSTKWNMPARYYRFEVGDVTLFGLDSGPSEVSQTQYWLPGTRGPAMQEWLSAELAKTTTKWKFAFAHHPYVSNSQHGDAGLYDNSPGRGLPYRRMLDQTVCNNMQVFFAGHDHNLQWLAPTATCGDTQFIVSGAGGASLYQKGAAPENTALFEDYQHHGFWWVDVTGDTFTGVAYDQDANELFRRSFSIA